MTDPTLPAARYARTRRGVVHLADCQVRGDALPWPEADQRPVRDLLAAVTRDPWLTACQRCLLPAVTAGEQLALGQELRDEAHAVVEEASDQWQRATVDQAIRALAQTRETFSANDLRPLLPPGIRPALIGARFMAASRARLLRKVGWTPSTDPGTHAHPIALWTRADQEAVA